MDHNLHWRKFRMVFIILKNLRNFMVAWLHCVEISDDDIMKKMLLVYWTIHLDHNLHCSKCRTFFTNVKNPRNFMAAWLQCIEISDDNAMKKIAFGLLDYSLFAWTTKTRISFEKLKYSLELLFVICFSPNRILVPLILTSQNWLWPTICQISLATWCGLNIHPWDPANIAQPFGTISRA
jgi:hypothetical protein